MVYGIYSVLSTQYSGTQSSSLSLLVSRLISSPLLETPTGLLSPGFIPWEKGGPEKRQHSTMQDNKVQWLIAMAVALPRDALVGPSFPPPPSSWPQAGRGWGIIKPSPNSQWLTGNRGLGGEKKRWLARLGLPLALRRGASTVTDVLWDPFRTPGFWGGSRQRCDCEVEKKRTMDKTYTTFMTWTYVRKHGEVGMKWNAKSNGLYFTIKNRWDFSTAKR